MTKLRKKCVETSFLNDDKNSEHISGQFAITDVNIAEKNSRSYYLNQAIAQLLPDDAAVLTLFYQGEQSIEEISQALGIETNAVKVKLFRARQRLKERLEQNLKQEVKELI